ncbi:MAG: nitrogen fixation protein NifQ [Coriobacteriia bacterium]|nr:nitrogen fixation protein NifQ [Coriobacteriia bacterium]
MSATTVPDRATSVLPYLVAELTGPNGPVVRFSEQVAERRVEFQALVELLVHDTTPGVDSDEAAQVARAVAAGCLGEQHLWRDMGLPSRTSLRSLLETYFREFAAHNTKDMRWKKFLYRRLCRWGGFATCKSPSCGACSDYSECFGPE